MLVYLFLIIIEDDFEALKIFANSTVSVDIKVIVSSASPSGVKSKPVRF